MCLHKKTQGGKKILTQIQTWPRDLPATSSWPGYSLSQFPYQQNRVILALWPLWDLGEVIKKGSWHIGVPALQEAPGPSSLDLVLAEVPPWMTGGEAELFLKDQSLSWSTPSPESLPWSKYDVEHRDDILSDPWMFKA